MQPTRRNVKKLLVAVLLAVTAAILPACETAPYLRQRGYEAFQTKQYEKAAQYFAKALDKDPSSWQSHYYQGLIYLQEKRALDAQLVLEMALSIKTSELKTSDILDALAESLYQQNKAAALHAILAEACDTHGTSDDFLRQGRYLSLLGDADNAKVAFEKAAHFDDRTDAGPYLAMADFYESISDTESTVRALRQALHLEPDNEQIHERLRRHGVIPGPTIALPIEN